MNFKEYQNELTIRGYSKETIKSYVYFNQRLLNFTKKSTNEITLKDVQKYLLDMIEKYGAKPATLNKAMASFKSYYSDFMKRKFLNALRSAKSEHKEPIVLTKNEIMSMIDKTINIKHKLLIELLYSSGLRVGEAVKLKIEDIYFNDNFILVKQGKGKKDRYVLTSKRFTKDATKYLEDRKDDNPYVFISDHNNHITIRTAEEVVKKAAKKANIRRRVFPHALRSTFATHLHQNGVDILNIQKLMGHARTETTRGYTKTDFRMINSITSPLDND